MPIALQDSRTAQNLMRAFAGESQARNRYTFAAELCRNQNLHILDAVFKFTANQEKEHAEIFYRHLSALNGQKININADYPIEITDNISELLQASQNFETEEFQDLYPAFAEIARQEGFPEIARSFDMIAKIEKMHGDRFQTYFNLLQSGELFSCNSPCAWLCLNCGHIHEGPAAPETCPVCSHNQGFFIRLDMAPYGAFQ